MPCLTVLIEGPLQSGKSTVALGLLERLHAAGEPVLLVMPTPLWAQERQRCTKVPCIGGKLTAENLPANVRAVAIDDMARAPHQYSRDDLAEIERKLGAHSGPTQLLLIRD